MGANGVRVIIIDEAQELSKSAWDILLKPVEEPKEGVFWIFCTTEGSKVPKAIKSRCHCHNLNSVGYEDIHDLITEVANKERYTTSEKVIEHIAKASTGSPRRALTLLAQCSDVTKVKEAAIITQSWDEGDKDAGDLAVGLLLNKLSWDDAMKLVANMKSMDGESVRRTVMAIGAAFVMRSKQGKGRERQLNVMHHFSTPYPGNTRMEHVILSIAEIMGE